MARIELPAGEGQERARMWRLRPEMGAAADSFSAVVQACSILSIREQEAARIRIAHINQCIPCTDARIADMADHDLDEAFYANVDDPALRGSYSEREQLAIAFAERFCAGADQFDDVIWARLRSAFSPAEIVDLAGCCAKWLGLGRINAVLDLSVTCPIRLVAPKPADARVMA